MDRSELEKQLHLEGLASAHVGENVKHFVLGEKVFSNKEVLGEVITLFDTIFSSDYNLFSKYLKENFNNYSTYQELFNVYKNKRLNEYWR